MGIVKIERVRQRSIDQGAQRRARSAAADYRRFIAATESRPCLFDRAADRGADTGQGNAKGIENAQGGIALDRGRQAFEIELGEPVGNVLRETHRCTTFCRIGSPVTNRGSCKGLFAPVSASEQVVSAS